MLLCFLVFSLAYATFNDDVNAAVGMRSPRYTGTGTWSTPDQDYIRPWANGPGPDLDYIPWTVNNTFGFEGSQSMQTGATTYQGAESVLIYTWTGPARISFQWNANTNCVEGYNCDYVAIFLDGKFDIFYYSPFVQTYVQFPALGGTNNGFIPGRFTKFEEGTHELVFVYLKSGPTTDDDIYKGFLDNVEIEDAFSAGNDIYNVRMVYPGTFTLRTADSHPAGSGISLTYGSVPGSSFITFRSETTQTDYVQVFDYQDSVTPDTGYTLQWLEADKCVLSMTRGGTGVKAVCHTADYGHGDDLTLTVEAYVSGTTYDNSYPVFVYSVKNNGGTSVTMRVRHFMDFGIGFYDGPSFQEIDGNGNEVGSPGYYEQELINSTSSAYNIAAPDFDYEILCAITEPTDGKGGPDPQSKIQYIGWYKGRESPFDSMVNTSVQAGGLGRDTAVSNFWGPYLIQSNATRDIRTNINLFSTNVESNIFTITTAKPTRSPVFAPPTSSPSVAPPTPGFWVYYDESECSSSCGGGSVTRRVECEKQGEPADDCPMPAPDVTVPCNVASCPDLEWKATYGGCKVTECPAGERPLQSLTCQGVEYAPEGDAAAPCAGYPPAELPCTVQHDCPTSEVAAEWFADDFDSCDQPCAYELTREVACLSDGEPVSEVGGNCRLVAKPNATKACPAQSGCMFGDCEADGSCRCPRSIYGTRCEQGVVLSEFDIGGPRLDRLTPCVDCPVEFTWSIIGDYEGLVSINIVDSDGNMYGLGTASGTDGAATFDLVERGIHPGFYSAYISISETNFLELTFALADACSYLDCERCEEGVCQCSDGYTGSQCEVAPLDPCEVPCADAANTATMLQALNLDDAVVDDLDDCERCSITQDVTVTEASTSIKRGLGKGKGQGSRVDADTVCRRNEKMLKKDKVTKKLEGSGETGGIAWTSEAAVACVELPDKSDSVDIVTKTTAQRVYEYPKQSGTGRRRSLLALGAVDRETFDPELDKFMTNVDGDYQNDAIVGGSGVKIFTQAPTARPTRVPTGAPSTVAPSVSPTSSPTVSPTSSPTRHGTRSLTCEIDMATFECQRGVIQITHSSLGREADSGAADDKCPDSRHLCGDRRDVAAMVANHCDGRAWCNIYVGLGDLGLANDDPCPGVPKYLDTYHVCIDPDTKQEIDHASPPAGAGVHAFASVCVGDRLGLHCDEGLVITKISSKFGRPRGKPTRCHTSNERCDAMDVSKYYEERCLGTSSCTVLVEKEGVCRAGYLVPGEYTCGTELDAVENLFFGA